MSKEWTLEEIEAIPEDPKAKKEYSLDEIDKLDDAILTKSGLKEAALKSIPVAAGLAGGAAGFLSPVPGGAFIGGTSGAAAGKMLENAIRRQEGEEIDPLQAYVAGPAQEAAGYAAGEAVVPAGSAILKGAGNAIGTAAKKVTSALSMVPEKVIETFASRTDDVAKLGNMSDPVVLQDAADTLREGAVEAIENFKSIQNKKITDSINENGGQIIDLEPVYKILDEAFSKLHPTQTESKALINEAYEDLSKIALTPHTTETIVARADALKQKLYQMADFTPDGMPLMKKDVGHQILKRAATRINRDLRQIMPQYADANLKLSQLRKMEKLVNKRLLQPETSMNAMMGVGSGTNPQALKQMTKLENLTGFNYINQAENVAAAKHLNKASILPQVGTGARMAPILLGGAQGVNAAMQGNYGQAAAGLGLAALSSPMAIEKTLLGANAVKKGAQMLTPSAEKIEMGKQMINRAVQMMIPPFVIDKEIKKSPLTNTEKATLRKFNTTGQ